MTPLDMPFSTDRNPTPAAPQPAPPADFRVLVADDQRDVIEAVRLLLPRTRSTVLAAGSPAEAIASPRRVRSTPRSST